MFNNLHFNGWRSSLFWLREPIYDQKERERLGVSTRGCFIHGSRADKYLSVCLFVLSSVYFWYIARSSLSIAEALNAPNWTAVRPACFNKFGWPTILSSSRCSFTHCLAQLLYVIAINSRLSCLCSRGILVVFCHLLAFDSNATHAPLLLRSSIT